MFLIIDKLRITASNTDQIGLINIKNVQSWFSRKKLYCVLTGICLLACGCASKKESTGTYSLTVNNIEINVNMDAEDAIKGLGDPETYFEAPLCADVGKALTYVYPHFELGIIEKESELKVYSITLVDDLISTDEGISLGADSNDVISTYGEMNIENGVLRYYGDQMQLEFIIHDDVVASVRYVSSEGNNGK